MEKGGKRRRVARNFFNVMDQPTLRVIETDDDNDDLLLAVQDLRPYVAPELDVLTDCYYNTP